MMIARHPPDRASELSGPSQQRHGLHVVVWLPAVCIHCGQSPLPGIVDARIDDEPMIRLLNPQSFVIDQHLHGLPPASLIDGEATVMEPDDAAETTGVHGVPFGTAKHYLACERVDSALGLPACMCPVPPELIVVHEWGVLPRDYRPFGAADERRIQHPAVDGKATFRQVLPGRLLDD